MKPTLIFDSEVYRNYYLASFLNVETGNVRHVEMFPLAHTEDGTEVPEQKLDIETLNAILRSYRIVTFNGHNFDLPLLNEALRGSGCLAIKRLSDQIIVGGQKPWAIGLEAPRCDHIDIFDVAPGMASLKIYGGRLHCRRLQDLPIDPAADIFPEQRATLRQYCENDLQTTLALWRKLEPQVHLREQMSEEYGIDLRSKSDAQIAEAVIRKGVEQRLGARLEKPTPQPGMRFRYAPPEWIRFATPAFQDALQTVRDAALTIAPNGTVEMPPEIAALRLRLGDGVYRMGIGGLHSSETTIAHRATDETFVVDRDVTSYYPNIILRCGLQPAHMGRAFSDVYRGIVHRRIAAKFAGDSVTADSLKIVVNGSFGKFGSPYSILYSPQLLIQTTLTGQLALLMLIEMLEAEGFRVLSANTDGIVISGARTRAWEMETTIWRWENATGFATEETEYRAIYSRDVNNYIAVKPDGKVKLKGAYAPAALMKNPTAEIATAAAVRYLADGVPVRDTILSCQDVTKFVCVRQVKGGAVKDGEYLGKAVRWYYARGTSGSINYKLNGYVVARTEGARPLMELPDVLPGDTNHEWYIAEAEAILAEVGAAKGGER